MVAKQKKKDQKKSDELFIWSPTIEHWNSPYRIIKTEREYNMTKERLKQLCKLCERESIKQGHRKGCPFREISGDYCRLYELIVDELEIKKENKNDNN